MVWASWMLFSALLAMLIPLTIGHLLSFSAKAEIEAAVGML